ncbi:SDR family NAD(P)-dependent oxidoreductase [Microlunatus elymi]|uniref:SDR family NAD(P)-dependent oxidoreductase n=1 Tax=Microlunatus elymi TaxID=2596828 RepID=A0A516PWU0_9ACTN|nr:NmrA family NAD(P)-binding protein [Microlunatus elymi]QDP95411.1 SDR family NAD(P)-dependent oxidoreductase [Microlunatus elymi]
MASGAQARRFDFAMTPAEFDRLLDGVDRVFLMRPPQIEDVQRYLFPFIDAANRHQVRQLAFLSLPGVQFNTRTPHHAVEQHLKTSHAPHTFLRPNFFMQNLSSIYPEEIRDHSNIYVPAGRSFTVMIDARDVGRVAAVALTEPGHLQKAYSLSGEQPLSYHKIATVMTDVLGRFITYARPSESDYLVRLAEQGRHADYIAVQKMIYRMVRLNVSAIPDRVVRKLTGQPATTLREFVHDYRDVWQPARRPDRDR